jgi:hypothetical protein
MLSNFSQYAPQGLAPQIPGMQPIGPLQLNSALPGQPGIYGNPWLGHELGQQGLGQQQPAWGGQFNPFVQNPVQQNPLQVVPVLGQLAQQLTIQSVLTQQIAQQICHAVQHLAHQLALQGLQGQYYGQNPLAASIHGGYSGFNPQTQPWGVARPQTIQ